ncbi:MAG: hypothetical protein ACI8Y4_000954 [Candidatus Poriferisodalaceae bacterium]|jgi:hypothetical protein
MATTRSPSTAWSDADVPAQHDSGASGLGGGCAETAPLRAPLVRILGLVWVSDQCETGSVDGETGEEFDLALFVLVEVDLFPIELGLKCFDHQEQVAS